MLVSEGNREEPEEWTTGTTLVGSKSSIFRCSSDCRALVSVCVRTAVTPGIRLSLVLLLPSGGTGGGGLDGPFGSRPTVLILFLILSFTVLSSLNMLQTPESHLSLSVGVCVCVCVAAV